MGIVLEKIYVWELSMKTHVYVAVKLREGGGDPDPLLFRVFALKLFLSLVHCRSGCN